MKCRNCKHLSWAGEEPGKMFFGWCHKVLDTPDPDIERWCRGFERRTNADRIRAMSHDNLLNFFVELVGNMGCSPNGPFPCFKCDEDGYDECRKCWGEYLQQPAEEEDT